MALSRMGLLAVAAFGLAAAGCQSERLSRLETSQPEPLTPAPTGQVTGGQLPPPASPASPPADPSQFPTTPGQDQVASAAGAGASLTPPATAPDITASSVAGVWSASVSGQSCRVATPQTKFGSGYRAGPLRCPAPLDGVKSWNVSGKQLSLYDQSGGVLARLYSTSPERFDGQTATGTPISLSR